MKTNNTRRGFTLIELLVVVLIIGILAAVALPQYQKAVEKARLSDAITIINSLQKALDIYILENGYPSNALFLGNSADKELDINIGNGMNCTQADGDICSNNNFAYLVNCESEDPGCCFIYAYRVANGDYDNEDIQYSLSAQKCPSENKWKYICQPQSRYPYSDALCKSIETLGWVKIQ